MSFKALQPQSTDSQNIRTFCSFDYVSFGPSLQTQSTSNQRIQTSPSASSSFGNKNAFESTRRNQRERKNDIFRRITSIKDGSLEIEASSIDSSEMRNPEEGADRIEKYFRENNEGCFTGAKCEEDSLFGSAYLRYRTQKWTPLKGKDPNEPQSNQNACPRFQMASLLQEGSQSHREPLRQNDEVTKLERQLLTSNKENKNLRGSNEDLFNANLSLKLHASRENSTEKPGILEADLKEKIKMLQNHLFEKERVIESLSMELKSFKSSKNHPNREILESFQRLSDNLMLESQKKTEFEQQLSILKIKYGSLSEELQRIKWETRDKERNTCDFLQKKETLQEIEELAKEKEEMKREIAKMKEEMRNQRFNSKESESTEDSFPQKELNETKKLLKENEKEKREALNELKRVQELNRKLESQLSLMRSEIEKLKLEKEKRREEQEASEKQHSQTYREILSNLEALKEKNDQLEMKISKISEQNSKIKEKYKEMLEYFEEKEKEEYEKESRALKKTLANYMFGLDGLHKKFSLNEKKFSFLVHSSQTC